METIKLLQITEPGVAKWRDAPLPKPGEGEVLVKVLGVTTCPHWDIHIMNGRPMFPGRKLTYPYTRGQPGHEAVGEVAALGPGVTEFEVGTRVAAWRDPGHDRPGCYAQYVCVEAENLIAVPPTLPPEAVAPLELAMCVQVAFDQLCKLDAVQGKRFGVSGLGPAGLIAVQMARAYGAAQVVGIEPQLSRRMLARQLGADTVVAPGIDALPADRFGPESLDAAIDCTGYKSSIEYLMDRTKEAVSIFGVLRENVTFRARHWDGLTLMGYGMHNRQAAERALKLVEEGQIKLAPLVTHILPFSRYDEGIALLRRQEAVKVCFLPWAD